MPSHTRAPVGFTLDATARRRKRKQPMTEQPAERPYVDPHHRVPDDQWGQVVKDAKKIREESDESETE
jgi:hypothetical protein